MKLPEFPDIKILLVEDEAFIRATLRRMLRSLGNPEVREAPEGTAALEILQAGYAADLILCDVHMEPMDGLVFMHALRNQPHPALAGLPAVMLTAASDSETVSKVAKLGRVGYLVKPVSHKLLADRIEAMLPARGEKLARTAS